MRRSLAAVVATVLAALVLASPAAARGVDNAAEIVQVDASAFPSVEVTLALPERTVDEDTLTLTEGGEPVPVTVRPVGITGLRVALVIDTSGSMEGDRLTAAKQSAAAFVESLPDGASAAVVAIADQATLVEPFTGNRVDLVNAIEGLEAEGGTTLYDGIGAALTALGPPTGSDRAIIVLTDGEDTDSQMTQDEVVDRVAAADVQFTGISLQDSGEAVSQLDPIAAASGGRVFAIDDPSLLVGAYGLIAASLESRYEVSFTSTAEDVNSELVFSLDGDPFLTEQVEYRLAAGRPAVALPDAEVFVVEDAGLLGAPWIPWTAALLIVSGIVGCVVLMQHDAKRQALLATSTGFDGDAPGTDFAFDERIAAAEKTPNPSELLSGVAEGLTNAAEKVLESQGRSGEIAATIERAGLSVRPGELGAFVLTTALAGLGLGFALGGPIVGLLLALAPIVLTPVVLKFLAARRRKQFGEQLGDTLILISGALQAGYGLAQSLDSVASEAPSPTREEFSRALLETRLGLTLEQALDAVDKRMQCEDFTWVVNAVKINATVGGDLSKILDQVGETIRARTKIKRQIAALAAEGKISALVLFALPPGLVFFIATSNPDYISPLFSSSTGNMILGVAGVMMAVGGLWLRKLVNPEV